MHILSLVTDNNPPLISGREENGRINDFMINLHESMGHVTDCATECVIGFRTFPSFSATEIAQEFIQKFRFFIFLMEFIINRFFPCADR